MIGDKIRSMVDRAENPFDDSPIQDGLAISDTPGVGPTSPTSPKKGNNILQMLMASMNGGGQMPPTPPQSPEGGF